MASKTVWAVEFWEGGHWRTGHGGLTKAAAMKQARVYAKRGDRVSIAEYGHGEGTTAVNRQAVG